MFKRSGGLLTIRRVLRLTNLRPMLPNKLLLPRPKPITD